MGLLADLVALTVFQVFLSPVGGSSVTIFNGVTSVMYIFGMASRQFHASTVIGPNSFE